MVWWYHHRLGKGWELPPQVRPQPRTALWTLLWTPHLPSTCSVQARPPHLLVIRPHPRDGLTDACDSAPSARSSASVNRLCQLNSWPDTRQPALTSIPPNTLRGQKEPASTSLRSSWLNPNLGEMQAVLMERGEMVKVPNISFPPVPLQDLK